MPTRAVTTEIRDKAERAIADAAAVLSERFGIAYQPVRAEGKDRDYLAAMELSGIAGFLTDLAAAESPYQAELADLQAELAAARDAALAGQSAITELAEANRGWAEFGGVVQALLQRAVTDDALRTALVEAGFIQAMFGETTGWTVSVVGIGVDLDALIEAGKPLTGESAEQLGDVLPVPSPEETREMTRAELDEAAAQLGIEGAAKLPNKQAVIDAITARSAELLATADPAVVPGDPRP